MLFNRTTFIGIDPTAGKRPFIYVALDHELKLLALSEGTMEEVLAFVGGQQEAYVAVTSPRRPNQGVMADEEIRVGLSPPPRPGRWRGYRLVEYQLRQHNIQIHRTPAREEDCPGWMRMGFKVYKRLEYLGYRPFPTDEASRKSLEVYPHACFCVWLGRTPFPKKTLEGRLQRQLVLFERGLEVPDPMRFFEEITRHRLLHGILPAENLYTPSELDALAAAFTAHEAALHPERLSLLGDPDEGQIVVPEAELLEDYK